MSRLFAVVSALASLTAGPAAPADTGVLAIGDFGVGGMTERRMGAAMERFARGRPADALVTLGDNDYTERPAAFRRNWRTSFGWASTRGLRVAGALGNHDVRVQRGRYEYGLLEMPKRYYHRRFGDIAVFLLDSTRVDRMQTAWLRSAVGASTAPWKVAVLHHPPFACGGYRGNAVVARWVPLFERYGVDLVLSGHDHNYQRFAPRNGVTYVVHGGGGAGLYALERCPASYPRRVAARKRHGWLYLRAGDGFLRVRAVTPAGRFADTFHLYP